MSSPERKYIQVKHYYTEHADKRDIEEIIACCKSIFNSVVVEGFLTDQNLKVDFLTQKMVSKCMSSFVNNIFHHI